MFLCCCCEGPDVILFWNSNAITDDNFDVKLNGTLIGSRTGNDSPLCKATMWSKDEAIDEVWSNFPAGCSPVRVETFDLDTDLFVEGTNTLELIDTQNNGAGNFGILQLVRLKDNGDGTFTQCKTWLNTTYGGSQTNTFTWSANS